MLVIRQEQMDTLIKGTEDEWVEKLLKNVKQEDPEINEDYDDPTLRKMIRVAIRKSERFGFTSASDQAAFVAIMFETAPNFDDQPEIKAIIEDDRIKPKLRLERLWSDTVPDAVWEKAAADYNEDAWNDGQPAAK